MTKSDMFAARTTRASVRSLVLAGTALGCSLATASPALAQASGNVSYTGPGPYTLTQTTPVVGGPRAIDVTVTSGDATVDTTATTVTSTNTGTTAGTAVGVNNTGAGNVTVRTGTLTGNGSGTMNAIDTRATTGAITIVNAGTINASGNAADRAIVARSGGGNVTITSNVANGQQYGVFVGGNGGTFGDTGTTTITSTNATANGTGLVNAIVAQGYRVVVNSGTATNTNAGGNQGTAIFANASAGGVLINAGTTNAFGQNQAALQVFSEGAVDVTSGTVRTTQNSDGVSIASGTDVVVRSTAITTEGSGGARGIVIGGNAGGGGFNSGANGFAYNSATITSGSIATAGQGAYGIYVTPTGSGTTTITSRDITTTGAGAYGIYETAIGTGAITGATTITTTGQLRTSNANGIQVAAGTGAVTINNSGTITTGGATNSAINVVGTTGAVTINTVGGTATSSGDNGHAIQVATTTGPITINAGTSTTTGLYNENISGSSPDAISVTASGAGAITITSANASSAGQFGSAIFATSNGGSVSVNSGNATTTTAGGDAIGAIALGTAGGDVVVNATTTTAAGSGIGARAVAGNVTVVAGSATAAAGNAISAVAGRGLASVTATNAAAGGNGAAGVNATATTGVVLNIGSASSSGVVTSTTNVRTGVTTTRRADAVYATTTNGAITATIGSATATGGIGANTTTGQTFTADAVRLIANGTGGAVTATITGQLSSASGYGLFIDPPGAVVVNVGAAASIAGRLGGINTIGASNAITNLGSISSTAGAAIQATGATTLVNSGRLSGANGVAVQLGATNDSVTLTTGSSVTGRIVGGGGTDAATLSGSSNAATATQTVAGFDGFDNLTVQSGYWSANAASTSAFNSATINPNATLAVVNGATGVTGVTAGRFVDNGTLVVQSSAASAGSTFGASTVTGSGTVLLTGAGTVTLDRTNTIATTGTTTVDGGSTLLVTGTQGGTIATTASGTILVGTGGTTGSLTGSVVNNGQLVLNRSDDTTFAAGLSGAGNVVKQGAGKVTFGSNYAFTGVTTIQAGSIRLSTPVAANTEIALEGAGQLDLSGTAQTVAELAGASSAASINIAGGSLTVNQATNTSFAGALVGAGGSFTKAGTGTLTLAGTSSYTGPTTVNGGRLAVNGSIVSPVTVNSGGTLGGTGSVGATTIASGGTFAPGNSIGTMTVNGNVTFAAGSVYQVEADPSGGADRINATGIATLGGGTVQVLAATGTYARLTDYTILTAAGGVNGRFAGVTSNLAFLTPRLNYAANAVTLTLARNDIAFATFATTGNEAAVAGAIAARGSGDAIYNSVLFSNAANAQATFGALTGELNATLSTELIDNGRRVRDAVLERGLSKGDGIGMWATGLQSYANSRREAGLGRLAANRTGVIGGVDYTVNAVRLGINGGYQDDDIVLRGRASSASVKTTFAGLNVAYLQGPLEIQAGANYAWHDIDTRRTLGVSGLAATTTARPDANSAQLFAELGYGFTTGTATITPFLRNAYSWSRVKAFAETGGIGALSVARDRRDVDLASAGVRMTGDVALSESVTFLPHGSIAYQRGFGDLRGVAIERIGGTGPAFAITGASLGRDTLTLDGGFDVLFGQRISLGVGAFGSTSKQWADRGGKATIGLRF